MKTNEKPEGVARIARRSLVLVGLLVAGLWFAGPSRAQSSAGSAPSAAVKQADAGTSQAQAPPAAPQAPSRTATAKPAAPAEKNSAPGAKGTHEGITVHGHWTIEVRNPNGTLARHVEFENSLDPGFQIPITLAGSSSAAILPGGAAYLSGLMSGQAFAPAGSWGILLIAPPEQGAVPGPEGGINLLQLLAAPCVTNVAGGSNIQACWILQKDVNPLLAGACSTGPNGGPLPGYSCNLSLAPLGTAPTFTGAQLSGSVTATQTGKISTAATLVTNCNCGANAFDFTSLTSSTIPGAPISVVSGQTVQVTVVISFH